MAEDLDDGEFWLPSQFLTEEDILTDFGASSPTTISTNGFNSELGSPGDSVTETESDEDEFFAELTRRMSRSSIEPKDGLVLSGSPQSTLFPIGGSSRGSPTGPVSPPPAQEGSFKADDTASFDLLNAVAGEVAKLRMRREQQQLKGTGYFDSSRGFQFPPVKQQTAPVHLHPAFHGFFPHHHQPSQQFPQIWSSSHETMKQVNLTENGVFFHGGRTENHLHNRPLGLSPAAWPPLQRPLNRRPHPPAQNPSCTKRESIGTGVFLPRRVDVNPNPTESRKFRNKNDSTGRLRGQGNGFHGQRRYSENAQRPVVSGSNSTTSTEIRLPSEWTY
ncbi:hypothetical protein V2J09_010501 [Rumex salicifolius]